MKAGAKYVIGIDISEEACAHAKLKYGIDARQGNAENINLPNNSIDLITSFETIEHLNNPKAFLFECNRILSPNGTLIISTPNRERKERNTNPFHLREFSKNELIDLLEPYSMDFQVFTQKPIQVAWWSVYSLTAVSPKYKEFRGGFRLNGLIKACVDKFILNSSSLEEYKKDPLMAIRKKEVPLLSILNPYRIKRYSEQLHEVAKYYVVVASKRNN